MGGLTALAVPTWTGTPRAAASVSTVCDYTPRRHAKLLGAGRQSRNLAPDTQRVRAADAQGSPATGPGAGFRRPCMAHRRGSEGEETSNKTKKWAIVNVVFNKGFVIIFVYGRGRPRSLLYPAL